MRSDIGNFALRSEIAALRCGPRAFFYAGARALLVSHWYVNSDATVALIKGAFEELKASPKIARAEALRCSMLALIDKGPERFAHAAAWAPFVVVGVSAAAR